MPVDDFHQTLTADDLSNMVVIRLNSELKLHNLMEETILEGTQATTSARSGSSILKNQSDLLLPLG